MKKFFKTRKIKSDILSQYDEVDEIKELYDPPLTHYYEYDEIKTAVQDLSRMGCLRIEQITDPHDRAKIILTVDNRIGRDTVKIKTHYIGARITEKGMRYKEIPMLMLMVFIRFFAK